MPSDLNLSASEGRWMGLDPGTRRVGVALSDPLKMTAHPLTTLTRRDDDSLLEEILKLVREYEVERVVIGLPRHMDGRPGTMKDLLQPLVERLKAVVPVVWAEERLSTVEAERWMAERRLTARRRRPGRDAVAAAIILTWYLETREGTPA